MFYFNFGQNFWLQVGDYVVGDFSLSWTQLMKVERKMKTFLGFIPYGGVFYSGDNNFWSRYKPKTVQDVTDWFENNVKSNEQVLEFLKIMSGDDLSPHNPENFKSVVRWSEELPDEVTTRLQRHFVESKIKGPISEWMDKKNNEEQMVGDPRGTEWAILDPPPAFITFLLAEAKNEGVPLTQEDAVNIAQQYRDFRNLYPASKHFATSKIYTHQKFRNADPAAFGAHPKDRADLLTI